MDPGNRDGQVDGMKAAMTRKGSALESGNFWRRLAFSPRWRLLSRLFQRRRAGAERPDCARLQQAIASRHGSSGSQAAVERQRAELAR